MIAQHAHLRYNGLMQYPVYDFARLLQTRVTSPAPVVEDQDDWLNDRRYPVSQVRFETGCGANENAVAKGVP